MLKSTAGLALAALLAAGPALAGEIRNAAVERRSPGTLVVSWSSSDPVDVLVTERPDAGPAAARLVSPRDRDGRHELAAPTAKRIYILLRDPRTGRTVRTAERLLPLQQGSNFRDLGGYPAAGGKHVRWGMIYRSGATPLLTESDVAEVRALGLRQMIDLRSSEERVLAPTRIDGVRYSAIGYSMTRMMSMDPAKAVQPTSMPALYAEMPTFFAPHLRLVFAELLSEKGPIAYNCSAGQDRTGFVSAMILSALGTPRQVIIEDYHLSTAMRRPQYEMPRIDPARYPNDPVAALFANGQDHPGKGKARPLKGADGRAYLDHAFAAIERRWGSVDAYLAQEVGLSRADAAKLRAIYLE